MNLVLIGMRGAGKSTVGRIVADRLQRHYIDTDEMVVAAAGVSIRKLFEMRGEARFRRFEQQAIAEACGRPESVIAVGGGAVLFSGNRENISRDNVVVWLRATPETLARRITAQQQSPDWRPALSSLPLLDELRMLVSVRRPYYAETANITIDVDALSANGVADQVAEAFESSATALV